MASLFFLGNQGTTLYCFLLDIGVMIRRQSSLSMQNASIAQYPTRRTPPNPPSFPYAWLSPLER